MLMIVGDIHSFFKVVEKYSVRAFNKDITAIIQVGDFGYYTQYVPLLFECKFHVPVYFIDGNHEQHNLLLDLQDITEVHDNCFYVPRGSTMELDGRNIAFMGGASSVDKQWQLNNGIWSSGENIRDVDIDRMKNALKNSKSIDLFVTHVPPQSVIQHNFNPMNLLYFGLPTSWQDPNADIIEDLWNQMGNPQLVCGHMHKRIRDRNVTILNINDYIYV